MGWRDKYRGSSILAALLGGEPAAFAALTSQGVPVSICLLSREIDCTTAGPFNWGGNWSAALGSGGRRFIADRAGAYVTAIAGTVTTAPAFFVGNEATSAFGNMIAGWTPGSVALLNTILVAPYARPVMLGGAASNFGFPQFGTLADLTAEPRITMFTPAAGTGLTLKMKLMIFGTLLVP